MSEGYQFVPLPDRVHRCPRVTAVFSRTFAGAYSGQIQVCFICEEPIHIGSGYKFLQGGKVIRSAMRIQGRPGVPGASIKGMLRSRYEAITRSCIVAPKESGGIRMSQSVLGHAAFKICSNDQEMCPACALFGRMSQRSRISVFDFAVEGSAAFEVSRMPEQFSPNLHHVGPRRVVPGRDRDGRSQDVFEVTSLHGRKFALGKGRLAENPAYQQVEVIPSGAMLAGMIRFTNVLPSELGGLLVAIGKMPPSKLKIGAGKCHGFGRMRLHAAEFWLRGEAHPVGPEVEAGWHQAFTADAQNRFSEGENMLVRIHLGAC